MKVKELVSNWQSLAQCTFAETNFTVNLSVEDAAKVDALADLYPRRSKEQIISELVSAALAEIEQSLPYVPGNKIVATDEMGEPIYEDVGPTPNYLELTRKHLNRHRSESVS
ncbi:type 1 pili tip component [Teredinibacter waterburyi]|jgi:hypothetical protein|uniref:type 1 pili tip component n=1 Tax=Teredinibacter waterburyi TaxID=1500538 RepID=UPI00165FBED6|nr:type 1 pili tip component [Teredinibacter waterburyi]